MSLDSSQKQKNKFYDSAFFRAFRLFLNDWNSIWQILPNKLKKATIKVFAFMLVGSLFELASIFALTLFFRLIYSPSFIFELPGLANWLESHPNLSNSLHDPIFVMQWACLPPIIFIILKNVFQAISAWKAAALSANVSTHAAYAIMDNYLRMPYEWHLTAQKGDLPHLLQSRFDLGSMLLNLLQACSNIITVGILFGGLFFYAPEISCVTALFMFFAGLATFLVLRRGTGNAGEGMARENRRGNQLAQTILDGIDEIIIHQKEDYFLAKIKNSLNAASRHFTFLSISSTIPVWILESAGFFLLWLTIWILNNFTSANHAAISSTVALLALTAWRVLPAMNRIVGALIAVRGLRPGALAYLKYISKLENLRRNIKMEAAPIFPLERELVFENVTYAYPGMKIPALKNVSCAIPLGAAIGLVGRSGSGKSTFLNILCGLLAPSSGVISADGVQMNLPMLSSLRKITGYVPQKPHIFGASILEEIAFHDWGQEIDERRALKACKLAAIDFINDESEKKERSANALSGGQAQRLAIARALYNAPEILILDEATSGLDQAAEAIIQETLAKGGCARTIIISAHRLEMLRICDVVLWFEGGELVQAGAPGEIIPAYRKFLGKMEA